MTQSKRALGFIVISVVIIISAKLYIYPAVQRNTLPKGFQRIPNTATDFKSLVQRIVPYRKLRYWQYDNCLNNNCITIRSEGDNTLQAKINVVSKESSLFSDCVPLPICYSVLSYVVGNEVKYVTSGDQLIQFLGDIDNLEEAILVAKIHGFRITLDDTRGSSYKRTAEGFELYLAEIDDCPVKYTSVKINITNSGNISSKKQLVYYQTDDCHIY